MFHGPYVQSILSTGIVALSGILSTDWNSCLGWDLQDQLTTAIHNAKSDPYPRSTDQLQCSIFYEFIRLALNYNVVSRARHH